MNSRKRLAIIAIATSALVMSTTPAFAKDVVLNGSGATFALPLIDACKVDYAAKSGNTVNYSGGGSGKGRTDFTNNLVDFAGSDAPFVGIAEPANTIYAPIFAAPIAVMYNLPTLKENIYLTPKTIALIFSGEITNWNDPIIAKDNERVVKTPIYGTKKVAVKTTVVDKKTKKKTTKTTYKTVPDVDASGKPVIASYDTKTVNIDLPNQAITVWYRTDNSGTTENFAKFLNGTAKTEWPKRENQSFLVSNPKSSLPFNFQGASGSSSVAVGVKSKVGSISYAELSFATDNKFGVALIQNAAGEFVEPSAAGTSTFLSGGKIEDNGTVTVDFVKKIPGAYPLGTTSYGLAYDTSKRGQYKNPVMQEAVADWFTYVLEVCPAKYPEKGFAQITGPLATKAKEQIAKIK
ncbi:MAG: phosphate ABC transporter substrate-binding protein, PhoT family [Actinobacteria bacterium]|nr:phosphate ABC transporter substrate-binding protein, PhoT family [Actinomycetota bacterium]